MNSANVFDLPPSYINILKPSVQLEELYTLLDFAVGRRFLGSHADFCAHFGDVINSGRLKDASAGAIDACHATLGRLLRTVRGVVLRRMWELDGGAAEKKEEAADESAGGGEFILFTVTFCANSANDLTCPPHIL